MRRNAIGYGSKAVSYESRKTVFRLISPLLGSAHQVHDAPSRMLSLPAIAQPSRTIPIVSAASITMVSAGCVYLRVVSVLR